MRNSLRMLFSGVAVLAVLGGTCSAATLTYHFDFGNVGPLGNSVSGVVSFTAPVSPVGGPSLTEVTFQFDQPQPLLSTAVVNGRVSGGAGDWSFYYVSFGPGFPAALGGAGDYDVAFALYTNTNDPHSIFRSYFNYLRLDGYIPPRDEHDDGTVYGTVTRVVPEPATLWLVGMTLAGVAVRRRRR
jgi:PEP-CTERM motif